MRLAQGALPLAAMMMLLLAVCRANFIYPDEYEMLKSKIRTGERPDAAAASIELPTTSQNQTRPTGTLFDTFLPVKWRNHVLNLMSRGIVKFTLDVDRAIESTSPPSNGNLVFSPISLTVTLAMILLASGGQTFNEVAKILGLESGLDISHHSEIVHQMFGLLLQESDRGHLLNSAAPQCRFAFGVFVEDGYPVRNQFRTVSEKVYKSETVRVDFSHRNRQALEKINDWVRTKTENKIQNILSEPPDPSTAVIILSALYFNGEWNQRFMELPAAAKRRPFTVSPNETVEVNMMFNVGDFPYHQNKKLDLKIVGIPYKGLEVTMYAILPINQSTPLRELKGRLTPDVINELIDNMSIKTCTIAYPKMKLSSTLKLEETLKSLGLNSLFDPDTADLSILSEGYSGANSTSPKSQPSSARAKRQSRPIDQEFVEFLNSAKLPNFGVDELRNSATLRNPKLFADQVIHKVEMTVDEQGTEAAAATSVSLNRSFNPNTFNANRPFLFFVRHDPTKTIWFWASITRPDFVP